MLNHSTCFLYCPAVYDFFNLSTSALTPDSLLRSFGLHKLFEVSSQQTETELLNIHWNRKKKEKKIKKKKKKKATHFLTTSTR